MRRPTCDGRCGLGEETHVSILVRWQVLDCEAAGKMTPLHSGACGTRLTAAPMLEITAESVHRDEDSQDKGSHIPILALPKKRPAFVDDDGGGGFWICDAVGARDWRMLYVRCILAVYELSEEIG
jgi:hypothetical protein